MIAPTEIPNQGAFLAAALAATSTGTVRDLIARLPVVDERDYLFNQSDPERSWRPGKLHWYPVGGERGNAGRIKLAGSPENPLAERTVNGMEAIIDLERERERRARPYDEPPGNPRQAVLRYFDLPPLDQLPFAEQPIRGVKPWRYARDLARRLRLRLVRTTRPTEYAAIIEDDGIGQEPGRMHSTLLSLGRSDKPDKPYLIGVFGQGGSSAFAASEVSWILSRRASDVPTDGDRGIGWTAIRRFPMAGRRDVYWAYLAAHPDGRVLRLSPEAADAAGFSHGTRIAHLGYNFGKTEPARTLFQSLNHLLFNPVLPFELVTGPDRTPDAMWGNGYRLSKLSADKKDLDKRFGPQPVEMKVEAAV